jgi:hypothetical protein
MILIDLDTGESLVGEGYEGVFADGKPFHFTPDDRSCPPLVTGRVVRWSRHWLKTPVFFFETVDGGRYCLVYQEGD